MKTFCTSHFHKDADITVENGVIESVRIYEPGTAYSRAYAIHPKGYVNKLTGEVLDELEKLVVFFEEEDKKKFMETWIPNTRKML